MSAREDTVKQSLAQLLSDDVINLITQYDAPQSALELLTVHGEVLDKAIKAWDAEWFYKSTNFFCGKTGKLRLDQISLLKKYECILEAIAEKTSYTYTNRRIEHDLEPGEFSGVNFEDPCQALKMILMGNPVFVNRLQLRIENLCDVLDFLAAMITPLEHKKFRELFEASCILAGYDLIHLSVDDAQLLAQELLEKNLITTTQASNLQLSDAEQLKHFKLALHQFLVKEKPITKNIVPSYNKDLLAVDRNRYLHYNGKVCVLNVTVSEHQTITALLKKQAFKLKLPDITHIFRSYLESCQKIKSSLNEQLFFSDKNLQQQMEKIAGVMKMLPKAYNKNEEVLHDILQELLQLKQDKELYTGEFQKCIAKALPLIEDLVSKIEPAIVATKGASQSLSA